MSENEWEKFFDLVDKIVNMPGKTWQEKAAILKSKNDEYGSYALSEMMGWASVFE